MTENAPSVTLGSELAMVVPRLFFYLGWSPRDQPKTGAWVGQIGYRTLGDVDHGVPYGPDRWIFLYLSAMVAKHGPRFRGTLREIIETFKLPWSSSNTLASLRRVAGCMIEARVSGEELAPRQALVEHLRLFADNAFEIIVSDEFAAEVEHAVPYSLEHARAMGRSYATLDLYLWFQWALRVGVDRVLAPHKFFCLARTPYKRYQQLRERCERICLVWPECPFIWCPERRALALRRRRPTRESKQAHAPSDDMSRVTTHHGYPLPMTKRAPQAEPQPIVRVPPWKQRKPEPSSPNGEQPDPMQSVVAWLTRLNEQHLVNDLFIDQQTRATAPVTLAPTDDTPARPRAAPARPPIVEPPPKNRGNAIPWRQPFKKIKQAVSTLIISVLPGFVWVDDQREMPAG